MERAQLAFQVIGLIGIVAIIIWATMFKKHHEPTKRVFKWWAFWLSVFAVFVYFAINIANTIIYEVAEEVQVIYYLVRTIIVEASTLAEISLLLVIYLLLPHCSSHPSRHGDRPRMAKALRIGHAIFLFILLALWLSMFALRIRYQVEFVTGNPWNWRLFRRTTDRISTTYTIVYFLGTLEILAWSIMSAMRFLKERTDRGQVQLFMLALIAIPLLLRSTFIMGVVVSDYRGRLTGGRGIWLASEIIYILTTLAIYAGIVAIGRHFAKSPQPPLAPNGVNPSYGPNGPNFWNGPGLPPHHAAKPNMVVHEVAPPPLYHQQGHGNAQYSMPPPQHQPYLNQQPYPTPYQQQQQQQQQQPQQQQQSFQIQGYPQYPQPQHQQQIRSPQSPPPPPSLQPQQPTSQPYTNPPTIQTSPQHHPTPPSEVSGTTNLSELPSPIHTPTPPHAR
ncbi:MAG: hypothetical protein Q9171_007240 [Xanthocarpia ochracea]